MNVIVANKYETMLQDLNIDVIKRLNGEFEVDDLIAQFENFFFQRMILDITAIKDYKDIKNLQKLSISLDMDKVILLLDDSPEGTSSEYLSKLISMGIYNFTRNVEGIMYLYEHPNNYRDVAHIHQLDTNTGPNILERYVPTQGVRIIGVKNVTKQSGATTLIYMMKKQLEKNYDVKAIEVDKRDFMYFRDKDLISSSSNEVGGLLAKYSSSDIILVDVNESAVAESLVHTVIYLIEPSIIKLNRMMMLGPKVLKNLEGKKVILNQSLLSSKDVLDFEYESRLKIFYNMPPLDEREKEIMALNRFLVRLGFDRQQIGEEEEKKRSILGLFNL
ncbi:MAG: hypothetical protein HFH08_01570 [Bacilli bacterium]|nr:hypothetical protein [Bacilli bacterium]